MKQFVKLKWLLVLVMMVSVVMLSSCKAKEDPESEKSQETPEIPVSEDATDIEEPSGPSESAEENPPAKDDFLTYINANYNFSVNTPTLWGEAIESDSGDGVVLLENENFEVRVFASYLVEEMDIETYVNTYYQGWSAENTELKGSEKAFKLSFGGTEEARTAIVTMKNDKIYTFLSLIKLPLDSLSEQEKISHDETVALIEKTMDSFKILD